MSDRLDELLLQRGRLIERIAGQRRALVEGFEPLAAAFGRVDTAVFGVRSIVEVLRRHIVAVSAAVGALLLFKRKTALRWGARVFSLWKAWRVAQEVVLNLGGRLRS